jgi:L-iditol 2-dehydrogenase
MRASVLTDVRQLEVRSVLQPEIGSRDVLVRVAAVGLCGTDFHIFAGHSNYNTDPRGRPIPLKSHPQILGHEIVGTIEEVGGEITDLRVGDRVAIDQGLNCLSQSRLPECEYCATGDSHQCEFYREHGITGLPGGLAEYVGISGLNAVRIDSDLTWVEAALTEPLGCIVHTMSATEHASSRYTIRAQGVDRRTQTVLVCGAGPAGLLFIQYLRNVLGFEGNLIVTEPNARKRELAKTFGATTVNSKSTDLISAVHEMTKGRRVELLIDAAGAAEVFTQIPGLIRKQATVVLYGHGQSGVDLGVLNNVQFLEPTIVASVGASGGFDPDGRPATYRKALRLLEEGRIRVSSFITHKYTTLEDLPQAFAEDHLSPEYVKGVMSP